MKVKETFLLVETCCFCSARPHTEKEDMQWGEEDQEKEDNQTRDEKVKKWSGTLRSSASECLGNDLHFLAFYLKQKLKHGSIYEASNVRVIYDPVGLKGLMDLSLIKRILAIGNL